MEMFSINSFTLFLCFLLFIIIFSLYYEEELTTDCANKIIVINDKDSEINSLKCVNNNIIVQRRIRRELEDGKREKKYIMDKVMSRRKMKEDISMQNLKMEKDMETLRIAKSGLVDIKFKVKNDIKPKDNMGEAVYARNVFRSMNRFRDNFSSDDFQIVVDYLRYLLN